MSPEIITGLDREFMVSGVEDERYGFNLQLPDPSDQQLTDPEFLQQVETAWFVCDRFDLQTEIWRGRILRAIRDREKQHGDGRGGGFFNWLKERDISKTRAYSLIELANSADTLLAGGQLHPEAIDCFSKQAFIETAHAAPEVQQLVTEAAQRGDRITRRQVRQLASEWTAMSSDLLPPVIKEKAATAAIPSRYVAPLVRELEKLPASHQNALQDAIAESPDVDTVKQATNEARQLAKYLTTTHRIQALQSNALDLEQALEEALRLGCLNTTAELVNQAAQLEQAIAKLYTTWKRLGRLCDQLYLETGSSTPHLQTLLSCLVDLSSEKLQIQLGDPTQPSHQPIRLHILTEP